MRKLQSLLIGLGVPLVLALAFLAGGGVYRTVNAGDGLAYLVNRFTGKAWVLVAYEKSEVLAPKPKRVPLQGADLAIALAKNMQGDLSEYGGNFDWLRRRLANPEANGEVEMVGWKAVKVFPQSYWGRSTYLVSFTYRVAEHKEAIHARELLKVLAQDMESSAWDAEGFATWEEFLKGLPTAKLRQGVKADKLTPSYWHDRAWWGLARNADELGWFWLVDPVRRTRDLVLFPEAKAEKWEKQWRGETLQQVARHGPTLKPVLAELNASCSSLLEGDRRERAELALTWTRAR